MSAFGKVSNMIKGNLKRIQERPSPLKFLVNSKHLLCGMNVMSDYMLLATGQKEMLEKHNACQKYNGQSAWY